MPAPIMVIMLRLAGLNKQEAQNAVLKFDFAGMFGLYAYGSEDHLNYIRIEKYCKKL